MKYLLFTILGAILGGVFQYYASTRANEKLKKELIAELTALLSKQQTVRVTGDEQKRITELQAQIKLLEK